MLHLFILCGATLKLYKGAAKMISMSCRVTILARKKADLVVGEVN